MFAALGALRLVLDLLERRGSLSVLQGRDAIRECAEKLANTIDQYDGESWVRVLGTPHAGKSYTFECCGNELTLAQHIELSGGYRVGALGEKERAVTQVLGTGVTHPLTTQRQLVFAAKHTES